MPHRGEKTVTYLEPDQDIRIPRSTDKQGQEMGVSLKAIKNIITSEFCKFEQHFQLFKSDIYKAIEDTKRRFESKLTTITLK